MAKRNLYQGELLKTDDWGSPMVKDGVEYDAAGGTAVQNFIKKSLDGKWGCVYDNNKGKYYIFADEASRDIYLEYEELEQTEEIPIPEEIAALKLAEMNSYSNYRIVITLDSEQTKPTNAILVGQTGNKVVFVADTYDNDENPLLEGLTVNYTVTRPDGSKSFVTHFTQTGKQEELTVDKYLAEGQNTITVNIVGATSNAIANTTIVFQVIDLVIEDNYDISTVHDVSNNKSSSLSITWSVTGSSVSNKFIEWYIDGVLIQEDLLAVQSGNGSGRITSSFTINSNTYSEGRHNIQYRAWITVNEQRFYTRTFYRDFIVYNGGNNPIIAISYSLPIGVEPLVGQDYLRPVYYDAVQYTSFVLPVAVYKNNTLNVNTVVDVQYEEDGETKTDVSYTNQVAEGEIWQASIAPNITGDASIVITAGDRDKTTYIIDMNVQENNLNIHEITAGLRLDLRAMGKSNTASDRDTWTYVDGDKTYETVFSGVTFDDNSGWNDNALVLSNGDSIDIKYYPLTNKVATEGLTFEIEFSTYNVSDDNAVILDLKSDDGNAGLLITASEAKLSDSLSNTVSTKFKSNETYRIAFVVDPVTLGKPLILIYVNGALCGGIGYPAISQFTVDKTINIKSSTFAGVKVKHIRIYSEPLSSDDILNNYMLYRDTYREMEEIYTRNDLYVSSGVFDFDRIASILPIMFITDSDINPERNCIENLMSFTTADKKTPILLKQIIYINNLDPTTSFCVEYPQMTCQGTSSMNYPIKNLRLYIKDKAKGEYGDWPLPVLYLGNPSDPEKIISLSNPHGTGTAAAKPGKGKVSFKSGLSGTFSEGERKPQAVNCWTIKADYAESSSSHNTGVARIWNQVMRDAVIGGKYVSRTRAQAAVMNDPSNKDDVRTCVDGFPCVVFYRYSEDDNNWKFLGKYNFNNDKSTESVFGFCDIKGINYQKYDYEDSNESEYNTAYNNNPDDCREKVVSFGDAAAYEKTVRKFVDKEPDEGETPEPLTENDYNSYALSLCATPYEYSKTYQKASVMVGGVLDRSVYRKKIMTAGDISNKIYCAEVLENEAGITNFTSDVSEFDSDWEHGFEFRYPEIAGDDENPDAECQGGITNLRDFYVWCHSTMNTRDVYDAQDVHTVTISGETKPDGSLIYKQEENTYVDNGTYTVNSYDEYKELMIKKFQKEKWDHLDVFKIAAYYVYLMRFGAVDQVCKNSMFTTEGTMSYVQNTTTTGGEGGTTKSVSVSYDESYGNHCKWFFINYDNDTILGLNNDGQIAYGPDIDRSTQTGDGYWVEHDHPTQEQIDNATEGYSSIDDLKQDIASGVIDPPQKGDMYLIGGSVWEWFNESSYAYAGHNSVLWNNLEADDEFMTIVRDVDDAIYRAGLTYNNTITMFNDKQATMWCEHILNDDAKIKYVSQYTDKNNNHLSKMHGPRTSHRMWWLSKRFTYFDSKFVSGEYIGTKIVLKIQGECSNPTFTVMPTEFMNYGWGVTSRSMGKTGVSSKKDNEGHFETIPFYLPDGNLGNPVPGKEGTFSYSQGDPIEIYASPYISELDLSNFAVNLMTLDFDRMPNVVLGSQLKRLILGKEGRVNGGSGSDSLKTINALDKAEKLEFIDIRGFKDFNSLDVSNNLNMKEVYAFDSGLQGISFANGAKIERLSLPECYNTLQLHSVNYLTKDNIIFQNDNKSSLNKIIIDNCNALKETSFDFLAEWYAQRNGSYAGCEIQMLGVDWKISYSDLDIIEDLQSKCSITIRGYITLTGRIEGANRDETLARVTRIKSIFGENCFLEEENPPVVVNCAQDFVIINATATEVTANKSTVVDYSCDIYPPVVRPNQSVHYEILSGDGYDTRTGVTIVNNVAQKTARITTQELVTGRDNTLTIRVTYTYQGSNQFMSEINLLIKDPTYPSSTNHLSLSGPSSLKANNNYQYDLTVNGSNGNLATGSYDVVWSFSKNDSIYIDYENSGIVNGNKNKFKIVTTDEEPPTSFDVLLTATVTCENGSVFEKNMDILILNDNVVLTRQSNPVVMSACVSAGWVSDENVLMKEEAMSVTDLGNVFKGLVSNAFGFHELAEFENLETIPDYAFSGSSITGVTLPNSLLTMGTGAFYNCNALEVVYFDNNHNLTEVPESCFYNDRNLRKVVLPDSITRIDRYAFGNTQNIKKIIVDDSNDENYAVVIPNTLSEFVNGSFETYTIGSGNVHNIGTNSTVEKIEIPDGLGTVEGGYFDTYLMRGTKITEFVASQNNLTYSTPEGVLYNLTQQTMYKYPCGKVDKQYYEPSENCLLLYDYGFANTKLTHIKTGIALGDIGTHEFDNSSVVTVDMSDSLAVTSITHYAFYYCTNLTTVVYPPDVRVIGAYVYCGNNSMTQITIPNTVTRIHKYVISSCPSIQEMIFPDSITELYNMDGTVAQDIIITNCNSLKYIKFPKYLRVGSNICDNNPSLTGVTLPYSDYYNSNNTLVRLNQTYNRYYILGSSVLNLLEYHLPEDNANTLYFENDGVLYSNTPSGVEMANHPRGRTTVEIGPEVVSIVAYCFQNHKKITNIVIPDTVKSIGEVLCSGCDNLETAVVGSGITVIRDRIFQYCGKLKNVVFKSQNINRIEIQAMSSCVQLSSLTICSLMVPSFDMSTNMKHGKWPFGQIAGIEGYTDRRDPTTFTGRNIVGDKKVKVPYFADNSGNTSLVQYTTNQRWSDPLFTPYDGGDTGLGSGCGFEIEYLTFADDIYIKILDSNGLDYNYNGQDTAQIPYADSTIGIYQDGGVNDGYYKFSLGADIVSNSSITITIGGEYGTPVGVLRPFAYEDHKYTMQIGVSSATRGGAKKGEILSAPEVQDTVSKYDYDKLVSRLNSLEAKLRNLTDNE